MRKEKIEKEKEKKEEVVKRVKYNRFLLEIFFFSVILTYQHLSERWRSCSSRGDDQA